MKAFIVFACVCAATIAIDSDEVCFNDVNKACSPLKKNSNEIKLNCTSKYGAIDNVEIALQRYVNHHFIRSFEYLLMSTRYANYEANRPGFEKLFRGLSDNKWHEGIELIQYITSRGGEMNFNMVNSDLVGESYTDTVESYEMHAIARALGIEKKFTTEALKIHGEATRRNEQFHDPEISSHIEHEFLHQQRDTIRKLAGYVTDLTTMLAGDDSSLSLYLFDEYLQKQ